MAETENTNTTLFGNYEVIFEKLNENQEFVSEISVIRRESDEINELRKIVLGINEQDSLFSTTSNLSGFRPDFDIDWKLG
jgi:hypothetical protein